MILTQSLVRENYKQIKIRKDVVALHWNDDLIHYILGLFI